MPQPVEERDLPGLAVLLLVLLTAIPAAVIVLPNTASYVVPQAVRDLGLADGQAAGFVRACGLALPALLLAAPLSAAAARRLPAWAVLFAGLAVMLGAQVVSTFTTSLPAVGAVRVAEGGGAGAVLPAALVLAWQRPERRAAAGVWAGAVTASLVLATPLALSAAPASDPDGVTWRPILHPYWWLGAAALVGTGVLGTPRLRRGGRTAPAPSRRTERVQLLLPVAPAAGFAFLAVVTTYDWSPGAQLILAASGIAGLVGLAVVGSRDAFTGGPLGYTIVMIAVGLLTMPVTGPLAGLLGGRSVALAPFAAGAGCAVAAALAAAALGRAAGQGTVLGGYALALVAILLLLTMGTRADQWTLFAALCALGAGAGLSAGSALRHTEIGPALFGLSLCFPAVLSGHLVVGPLQVAKVGAVTKNGGGAAEALFALTAAYRLWLVAAGVLAVVLAAVTVWLSRSRIRRSAALAVPQEPDGAALEAG